MNVHSSRLLISVLTLSTFSLRSECSSAQIQKLKELRELSASKLKELENSLAVAEKIHVKPELINR